MVSNHSLKSRARDPTRSAAHLKRGTQSQAHRPPQAAVLAGTAVAYTIPGLPSGPLLVCVKFLFLWNNTFLTVMPMMRAWLVVAAFVMSVQPRVLESLSQERHGATHKPAFARACHPGPLGSWRLCSYSRGDQVMTFSGPFVLTAHMYYRCVRGICIHAHRPGLAADIKCSLACR